MHACDPLRPAALEYAPMSSTTATYRRPTLGGLFNLAWPVIISRSTQVVASIFDSFMVAYLGEAALAATTTGGFNSFNVFIFPFGIVFIVSTFASQLFGKGDLAGARRFAWYGLSVAAATQVLCLVAVFFIHELLLPFEYAADVREQLEIYLRIRLIAGGAAVGLEALSNYYSGLGNTRLPMIIAVATMVIDVVGNLLFIRGNLGFPALGVAGAAWTSSVSSMLGFAAFLLYFVWEGRGRAKTPLRRSELWEMLRFGVPSGLNWFLDFAAFSFFLNVVLTGLGTSALAGFMSVMNLNSIAFMPAFALSSAGAVLIGQAIGAGQKDDVPRTLRMALVSNVVWMALCGFAYVFLPEQLMGLFVSQTDPNAELLMTTGVTMLRLSALWLIFDATGMAISEALRAAGDTTFTMWARAALAWLVFAPGSFISVRYFGQGTVAVMLWVTAYIALLAVVLVLRFRSGGWRNIALTENVTGNV